MGSTHIDLCETHIIGSASKERILAPQQYPMMKRQHIQLCGLSDADENFTFIRKNPVFSQLLLTLSGSGRVLIEGQWQVCHPGDVYLTPLQSSHAYHSLKDWRLLWICYAPTLRFPHQFPTLQSVNSQDIEMVFNSLLKEAHGPADPQVLSSWFHILHNHALRIIGLERSQDRLDHVWQEVHQDLAAAWDARILADMADMSEEHFRRLCHARFQCSPLRYLTQLRMQHAQNLLRHEQITIQEIAEQVGYQNAFAFSTAFKRWNGKTPSQYRVDA